MSSDSQAALIYPLSPYLKHFLKNFTITFVGSSLWALPVADLAKSPLRARSTKLHPTGTSLSPAPPLNTPMSILELYGHRGEPNSTRTACLCTTTTSAAAGHLPLPIKLGPPLMEQDGTEQTEGLPLLGGRILACRGVAVLLPSSAMKFSLPPWATVASWAQPR